MIIMDSGHGLVHITIVNHDLFEFFDLRALKKNPKIPKIPSPKKHLTVLWILRDYLIKKLQEV